MSPKRHATKSGRDHTSFSKPHAKAVCRIRHHGAAWPRAVNSSLTPRNSSQDVAPATSGSLESRGEAGGLAAGGRQAASLDSPGRQKNVVLFSGKCSSAPRAKDNSGSKLLPPTVMEK